MKLLEEIRDRIIGGGSISREEASLIAKEAPTDLLCDIADEICRHFQGDTVDSCSIVNARSGNCGEDCKWCAQASRHKTGCQTYQFISEADTMEAARHNEREGIKRFSLVTSGRTVSDKDLEKFCGIFRKLSEETDLYLCASMGLLSKPQLEKLRDAGVKRYHCNMETSKDYFTTLCTTHRPEDKEATIKAARELGMAICSGGIIGMGENMEQRLDFAFELAALDVDSVPLNILDPIPGTPLEDTPLISEEEIIRTAAMFRLILPTKSIRFAGGRMRLSQESMLRMMTGGVNGVLMGDMLTTVSNTIAQDRILFKDAKLKF